MTRPHRCTCKQALAGLAGGGRRLEVGEGLAPRRRRERAPAHVMGWRHWANRARTPLRGPEARQAPRLCLPRLPPLLAARRPSDRPAGRRPPAATACSSFNGASDVGPGPAHHAAPADGRHHAVAHRRHRVRGQRAGTLAGAAPLSNICCCCCCSPASLLPCSPAAAALSPPHLAAAAGEWGGAPGALHSRPAASRTRRRRCLNAAASLVPLRSPPRAPRPGRSCRAAGEWTGPSMQRRGRAWRLRAVKWTRSSPACAARCVRCLHAAAELPGGGHACRRLRGRGAAGQGRAGWRAGMWQQHPSTAARPSAKHPV